MTIPTPEQSSLFTPWRDPVSGVESLLLSAHLAPVQKAFYYTHPSFSADGRFLWFECIDPPSRLPVMAVADLLRGTVERYPETQYDSRPYVDPETAELYWGSGLELWKRGPLPGDRARLVNSVPAELAAGRSVQRIASHLSRSADGSSFAIDARFGDEVIIGDLPLDGSPFRLWQRVYGNYDHALFSPTDPDCILIPQDSWFGLVSGEPGATNDRLWTIRRGGELTQLLPDDPLPSANRGHEWWHSDGSAVWFLDYTEGPGQGTKRLDLSTGEVEIVWPHGHSHSHCDRAGRRFIGDIVSWPNDAWQVAFYDRDLDREWAVVSQLPPCDLRRRYHIHPHPQFCHDERYCCYTTNVLGRVDLALCPTAQFC